LSNYGDFKKIKNHHNVIKVFVFVAMAFFLSFFLCQDDVKICQYRYTYIALTWYVVTLTATYLQKCNLPTKSKKKVLITAHIGVSNFFLNG
jgi:cell division protein FtsW (lipid II flippase)